MVYYKIGIFGSAREAVSSFVVQVAEDTTVGELEDSLADQMSKAGIEAGAEFIPGLLHHIYEVMNDETDTEPGAGERPPGD